MGTDTRGRDVFARVVHGTRTTLFFAAFVATAFTVVGALAGTLAGFVGGLVDGLLTRVVEVVSAFPVVAIVVVVVSLTGSRNELTVFAAIAAVRWTDVARVVRAEVLRTRSSDYTRAARALGASPVGILVRHILPNAVVPAVAASSFGVAAVILVEATVDFLGFGSERATGWGAILAEVRSESDAWWILLFPGAALFACLGSVQVVAEAVRDGIDPRLRDAPSATRPAAGAR
jgi:peptide/nickel transport system permease protein